MIHIVKLKFLSRIQHSATEQNLNAFLDHFSSPNLFSILVFMWKKLFRENAINAINAFNKEDIRISGFLPYIETEINNKIETTLFFPKPRSVLPPDSGNYTLNKKLKKVNWFTHKEIEKLSKGAEITLEDYLNLMEKIKKIEYHFNLRPVINVDRITANTHLFGQNEVYFGKKTGLFFIVEKNPQSNGNNTKTGNGTSENKEEHEDVFESEFFKKYLLPAIRLLKDEGIGGGRSTGSGNFKFTYEEFNADFFSNKKANFYYLLNHIKPNQNDINKIKQINNSTRAGNNKLLSSFTGWEFYTYRGWGYHHMIKKPIAKPEINMLKTGSILPVYLDGDLYKFEYPGIKQQINDEVTRNLFIYGRSLQIPVNYN